MTIGGSLLLIAVGAILRYATNINVKGIEIDTVGLILMIVGIVGFVIAVVYEIVAATQRSRGYRDRYAAGPDAPTRRYYE
jgi:beta-lactamase regulating signal transducer with metallopeptidase domain